jgi:IMP dehydrogenase
MLNEEVRKIMTKHPPIAHPDDKVGDVANLMLEKQAQQLPVVENGKLVGLVTAYDLFKDSRVSADSESKTVREVMTTRVIKITPKDKVGTAAELFMDQRFKMLPVVNLNNELKGVITAFDLLRHVLTREYPHPVLYSEVFDEADR